MSISFKNIKSIRKIEQLEKPGFEENGAADPNFANERFFSLLYSTSETVGTGDQIINSAFRLQILFFSS